MNRDAVITNYTMRLGDNALVLGQRLIELVAGGPELEEELANANFALDYIGQARMYYTAAGALEGKGRSEDDLAFLRPEHEFRNLLLVEQPNGHFGDTIVRQVLFESWYVLVLEELVACADPRLAEIAERALKEIRYHLRHGSQWLVRLGDGTDESHTRVQASLDRLWRYTGEMLAADAVDDAMQERFGGPNLASIAETWRADVEALLEEATLVVPADEPMASGGKEGRHTEHFGYLLAEMQFLQRAYPGATW